MLLLRSPSPSILRAIEHLWKYALPLGHWGGYSFMHPVSVSPKTVCCYNLYPRYELPDCQRVSAPHELGCGRQWGLPQVPAGRLKCFSTYPAPPELTTIIHPLACHGPSRRINPSRTAQLSMQRVTCQGSGVITSQTALSSVHGPRFLPASIQMVSVLG